MEYYSLKELAAVCNQDVMNEYLKIKKVLEDNELNPTYVFDVLVKISQGEDYAEDTINNISKRLSFITKMDEEKIILKEESDGRYLLGTVNSQKQQYKIEKYNGSWYAKVSLSQTCASGNEIAIKLNDDANESINKLFGN